MVNRALVTASLMMFSPWAAEAQNVGDDRALPSLDSILSVSVSTASLYEQSRTEAPGQVSVITAAEIAGFGYRNLAEILQTVPGFNMSSDLQYSYAGVRGFGRPADLNHRVLFLVDGHTLNESILGAIPVGNAFPVDVRAIERVEVIRGPGSPLYGTRAMLAVVNVITRKGRDVPGFRASVESGTVGTYGASLGGGGETASGLEAAFSASWFDTDGQDFYFPEFDSPATGGGVSAGMAWESYARGSGSVSLGGASFLAGFSRREKGIPTAPYGTNFNDPRANTEDRQEFFELGYKRELSGQLLLEGRLYHDHYENSGQYPFQVGLMRASFESRTTAGEAHIRWDPLPGQRIVLGGEIQRAHTATFDQILEGQAPIFGGSFPYWVMSVFAQDEVQLTRGLALTLGVRHDRYRDESRSTTNPRAALVYHPRDGTTLKATYGTAFRTPNVYERLLEASTNVPNPALVPETVRTVELAVEQTLSESAAIQLGVYQNNMKDLIDLVPVGITPGGAPILQFQNLSRVKATGVEAELSGRLRNDTRAYARYSFQRATDSRTSQPISNFPSHTLKLGVLGNVGTSLGVGLEGLYESGRMMLTGLDGESFWLVNSTVTTRPIQDRFVLAASLKNVFDSRYELPGGFHHAQDAIVQEGRRLYLELRVTP